MKSYPPAISVQWHITTDCENRCKHCYMYDEATFESERKNTLSYEGMMRVLDSFEAFEDRYGARIVNFSITGGDPFLRPDLRRFLTELNRRGKHFRLMGNPETLTDENIELLENLRVQAFQMSLDGLEPTHDYFRSEGSFGRTVEALDRLARHGIQSNIMFTLFPGNAHELIPLMRYVAESTASNSFSFDVGSFVGNAATMDKYAFSPERMRELFSRYLAEKHQLRTSGNPIAMREKPNLLKLTQFENKTYYPMGLENTPVISGCLNAWNSFALLSDGTLLACRRLPIPVGKMPEQSFEEIWLGSELLKKFRRPESYEACGRCDFYQVCRGCPANAYGLTGDPFSKVPSCFRHQIDRTTDEAGKIRPGPPLSTSYQEEYDFFASKFVMVDKQVVLDFLDDEDLRRIFATLAGDDQEKDEFLQHPRNYLRDNDHAVDDRHTFFMLNHFSGEPLGPMTEALECLICSSVAKFERLVVSRHLQSLF
ncbi:MAG: radical SAM protein [Acidobacteriota bacterium]